jgi:hypothetical protein
VAVVVVSRLPQLVVLVVAALKVLLAQTELLVRATRVATVALMVVVVVAVLVLLA